jgi:Vitamin K-dependent gamma-carboxylase/ShK domain-like
MGYYKGIEIELESQELNGVLGHQSSSSSSSSSSTTMKVASGEALEKEPQRIERLLTTTVATLMRGWNELFHSRTGRNGCRLGGIMRIGFAVLFLYDRILLGLDLDLFFCPEDGLVPFTVGHEDGDFDDKAGNWTLFRLAPESGSFLKVFHWVGCLQGLLLLLGVAPRFQLVGIYVNIVSYLNHNRLVWDGEDVMFKLWTLLLFFLPLDHFTARDLFESHCHQKEHESTWPMWPFRLWQIQICAIYFGTALVKLNGSEWPSGMALYYSSHMSDFFPGIFNPDFLFHQLLPLKLLCWTILVLEAVCVATVWIPVLRIPTIIAMIVMHVGVEVSMVMHCFEWLVIVGWLAFLVQPVQPFDHQAPSIRRACKKRSTQILLSGRALNIVLGTAIVVMVLEATPTTEPMSSMLLLKPLEPIFNALSFTRKALHNTVDPHLELGKLERGWWARHSGTIDQHRNLFFQAYIVFDDHTEAVWKSPDWSQLDPWSRKRYTRHMNFYRHLEQKRNAHVWVHLCKQLAVAYGPSVAAVEMSAVWEQAVPPPATLGWFDSPAQQPMEKGEDSLVALLLCHDALDETTCQAEAGQGHCLSERAHMMQNCAYTCHFCDSNEVIWPKDGVSNSQ